jgi:hypothetical protein
MSNLDYMANGFFPADRRARQRTHIDQRLTYSYYSPDGQKLGAGFGTTVNISDDGLMFETSNLLEIKISVLVELVGPLHMFMATGYVAHVWQVSHTVCQVGVAFHQSIQGGWELVVETPKRLSED